VLSAEAFCGLHFTGSTSVFDALWTEVARNLSGYRNYPRLVGETGGKDFVVAHASAEIETLSTALLRGAFEYQGQKCSAASRAYVPASLWPRLKQRLMDDIATIKMGDIEDFGQFMGAVIDRKAYSRIAGYIDEARAGADTILAGGSYCDTKGYFIEPTLIEVADAKARTMQEEIFGPVLSVFVYADKSWEELLTLVDETSPYALTGAIFGTDQSALRQAAERLRFS